MAKYQNGFTLKKAIKVFNMFGAEREKANRGGMWWSPDRHTIAELRDFSKLIQNSKRPAAELLNKAGYSLYNSEVWQ